MQPDASSQPRASRYSVIASFPPPGETSNPYQRLLYDALADTGLHLAPDARFRSRWLWAHRRDGGILHFHWLSQYYHHASSLLTALRLLLLVQRLTFARMLGFRVAWTVHEILPHDRAGWADGLAPRLVGRLAHVLIVHDEATREKVIAELGRDPVVIPHGSLVGVYRPPVRGRRRAREELGVSDNEILILCFGLVRRYKRLDDLVSALALVSRNEQPGPTVLVAGQVLDADVGDMLRAGAAEDDRLRLSLEFVPDDEVHELFESADAVLLTRVDDGTSGVLALALSLGTPIVLADTAGYRAATEGSVRSWRFAPGDPASLAQALTAAARELAADRAAGRDAMADPLPSWASVAQRTAAALRGEPGTGS